MSGPYVSANGVRVTSLNLWIPYYGIPVADVALASADVLAGRVRLNVGNASYAMSVARKPDGSPRTSTFAGVTTARFVGGAGSWSAPVALSPYSNPAGVLLSSVLSDLAMGTGSDAATREAVVLGAGLDRSLGVRYVPPAGLPSSALLSLLAGPLWYIDAMGTTQVAVARPATTIASQATVEELDGGAGWLRVATEDPAAWLPGARYSSATVASIKVSAVRVRSGNDGDTRIEVLT